MSAMMLAVLAWASGAPAQSMDHSMHQAMPATPAPAVDAACPPEHAAMGHCKPAPVPMPVPDQNAPPPPAPAPDYADRIWGSAAMAPARAAMRKEHGGGTFSQVMLDLAEYQVRDGRDALRWDGAGWFGGDVDRLVVKSEGAAWLGGGVEDAEVQALYSRAVGPYFNLQAGVRHDIRPHPSRTYAAIGFEGLAPYWFDVEGTVFLSDKGDLSARIGGYYDQRITQRLILQPRAELDIADAGLADVELGVRLRYEIAREFAPYVGMSLDREGGGGALTPGVVLGVRAWF